MLPKWMQWDHDPRRELRGSSLRVKGENARGKRTVAVLRQEAAAAVVAVVDGKVDRQNLHLEHVAGLRPLDVHRAGQDVPPRSAALAGDLGHDRLERALDLVVGHARPLQPGRGIGQQGVDVDNVARGDPQGGLGGGPVVPIRHGGRRGFEAVSLRPRGRLGSGDESGESEDGRDDEGMVSHGAADATTILYDSRQTEGRGPLKEPVIHVDAS
jgi:hypothetical protein